MTKKTRTFRKKSLRLCMMQEKYSRRIDNTFNNMTTVVGDFPKYGDLFKRLRRKIISKSSLLYRRWVPLQYKQVRT